MAAPPRMGPCAKRHVRCTIVLNHGQAVIGENLCANPQKKCPRSEDEGYEKCKTICRQPGHAEEQAIAKVVALGWHKHGGTAFVQGHRYACDSCKKALAGIGVYDVFIGQHHMMADGTPYVMNKREA